MFGTFAITALLATFAGTAYADVAPTVPGPGVAYKAGGICHIEWNGDTASTTAWKNMAIELMTGDNFHMVHLTTVATGLDGSVSGTFNHTCPDVNPYSAIYFYQFSAPGASGKTWTTRFAIASASGETTDPPVNTQPISGAAIPWGTGKLVDPSSAKPPPDFSNTSSNVPSSTPSSTLVTPTSTPVPTTSSSTTASPSIPISTGLVTILSPSAATTSSKTVTDTNPNAPSGTLGSETVTHTSSPTPACSCSPLTTSNASSSTLSSKGATPTPSSAGSSSSSTPTPSKMVTVTTSKVPTSTSSASAGSATPKPTSSGSGKDNGAIGLDVKMWKTAIALGTSAMAFALL